MIRKRWSALHLTFVFLAVLVLAGCDAAGAKYEASSYEGTELDGPAPGFRLTDQHGTPTTLSEFRGRVVVLAFMDTRCDETCPLTALALRLAHQALGPDASHVVFVGVNVNANFDELLDAVAMTDRFQLDEIPSWRFLTGPVEGLKQVWSAYSIEVVPSADPEEEDFNHTPGIYVIDQTGQLRWYLSTPLIEDGLGATWDGPSLNEVLTEKLRDLISVQSQR